MNVSDILAGPARVFFAPVGTTPPDETSVAYGAAWPSWNELGCTLTPVSLGYTSELTDIEVECSLTPAKRLRSKEEAMIETTLAELSAQNLGLAFGSTATTVAAGAGQAGYEEVGAGGNVTISEYAFGMESVYVDANGNELPVRVFVWRANAVLNGNLEFSKAAATGIPLQIKALGDPSQPVGSRMLKIQKVVAPAT